MKRSIYQKYWNIKKKLLNMTDNILSNALNYIKNNNKGDSNKYHNNKHILFVFENSMMIFGKYRKEYDLKKRMK